MEVVLLYRIFSVWFMEIELKNKGANFGLYLVEFNSFKLVYQKTLRCSHHIPSFPSKYHFFRIENMAVPFYIPSPEKIQQRELYLALNRQHRNTFYWKMIARALCTALKEYYVQSLASTRTSGAFFQMPWARCCHQRHQSQ